MQRRGTRRASRPCGGSSPRNGSYRPRLGHPGHLRLFQAAVKLSALLQDTSWPTFRWRLKAFKRLPHGSSLQSPSVGCVALAPQAFQKASQDPHGPAKLLDVGRQVLPSIPRDLLLQLHGGQVVLVPKQETPLKGGILHSQPIANHPSQLLKPPDYLTCIYKQR